MWQRCLTCVGVQLRCCLDAASKQVSYFSSFSIYWEHFLLCLLYRDDHILTENRENIEKPRENRRIGLLRREIGCSRGTGWGHGGEGSFRWRVATCYRSLISQFACFHLLCNDHFREIGSIWDTVQIPCLVFLLLLFFAWISKCWFCFECLRIWNLTFCPFLYCIFRFLFLRIRLFMIRI